MKTRSPVLEALARRYERSQAGRTGEAGRDLTVDAEELLRDAGAAEGESRALAEQQLREAERIRLLEIVPLHKRDRSSLHRIRFSPANEEKLYETVGWQTPKTNREALAGQFAVAAAYSVPARWQERWTNWCESLRQAALTGGPVEPFDRNPTTENTKSLTLLPKLLAWESESLVRFASCILCGDSKALESLAARDKDGEFRDKLRGKLGRLLATITDGQIRTLDDLGILPNPRFALAHGPLRLLLNGQWLDLGLLTGAFRLAASDIDRAERIATSARRCLTVENEATFHELAKLESGELLIQTSYPGSGTLKLLRRLPDEMEFWHFGDSDEAGFDILRVLREKSGRDFQPLHMQRGRVPFEQESLGRPNRNGWPFYD
jgi:hypothetical protein